MEQRKKQRKSQKPLVPLPLAPIAPPAKAPAPPVPWYLQHLEAPTTKDEPLVTWSSILAFASRVELQTGPKLIHRTTYMQTLENLVDLIKQWKTAKQPIKLIGDLGCGKTTILGALAHHLDLEAEFLHEIFLESPNWSVLEQFKSKGLGKTKLWVIEHFDTLTPQWIQALKKNGFDNMLKTGPVILTAWPSSKPKTSLPTVELSEWTFDTKLRLLKHIKPHLSLSAAKFLLAESVYIPTALEASQLWGNACNEYIEQEDLAAPSVNHRLLIEESFSDRWNDRRKAALDTCDTDLTLSLVQEMTVGASAQGRCEIKDVARHLDSLSFMDLTLRTGGEACKEILSSRLLQAHILNSSKVSLAIFSSGSLLPIPQALVFVGKKRVKLQANNDLIRKCRVFDEDTRTFAEDAQLFIQASKLKYVSPYSKQN